MIKYFKLCFLFVLFIVNINFSFANIYISILKNGNFSGYVDIDINKSTFLLCNISNGLPNNEFVKGFILDNSIYASSISYGLFYSKNNGLSWENKSSKDGLASDWVRGLFVYNNTIYLATHKGLIISQDEGKTWIVKNHNNGLPWSGLTDIFIKDDNLYAATNLGLFMSKNNGDTWNNTFQTNQELPKAVNNVFVYKNKVYILAVNTGLLISKDNGVNWINKQKKMA